MQTKYSMDPASDWDFWTQGLDQAFFKRLYVRSVQVGGGAALGAMGFEQKTIALGLIAGLLVGLFSVWSMEILVRLLFRGGGNAGVKLAIGAFIKMPFLLAALTGIAWASYHGFMNVFAVVGGVLLVHGAMLVMVLSTAMSQEGRNRERYR